MDNSPGNTSFSPSLEERVSKIEKELKDLKSPPATSNLPQSSTSNTLYSDISKRNLLINQVRNQQVSSPRDRSSSESRKRAFSHEKEIPYTQVMHKRNGVNPQKKLKAFYGKDDTSICESSDLSGPELHEVFLFNYRINTTEEKVKSHFQNKGVNVASLKKISHRDHYVNNFLMKITNKQDFEKIITSLPPRTGARWFTRDTDGDQITQEAQRSHFNKTMPPSHNQKSRATPERPPPPPYSKSIFSPSGLRPIFSPARLVVNTSSSQSLIPGINTIATTSAGETSVSNRFTPLTPQSLNFRVGGPLSITATDQNILTSSHPTTPTSSHPATPTSSPLTSPVKEMDQDVQNSLTTIHNGD